MKAASVDIAVITETKKKLKGTEELEDYLYIYSGVPQNKRASAGVAIFINKSLKNKIHSYTWINERLILLRCKHGRGYITIIGAYAPEEGRKEATDEFYEQLQTTYNSINPNDYVILSGDLNARVGNQKIPGIVGNKGEQVINKNGEHLREFCSFNELRVMNTFFEHKDIHKFTRTDGHIYSIIDYIIANRKTALLIEDVRVFRGKDIYSDHYLVISKLIIPTPWKRSQVKQDNKKEIYKVNLLQQESIKYLYQRRLDNLFTEMPVSNNINLEWETLKKVILQAAEEALGKRIKRHKKEG